MQDGSVSLVKAFFHNKWVKLILAIDILIIVFIIIALIVNARKTSAIEFNIVPADSQILVNGQAYTNGAYHITPGIYTIEISHPDLNTKVFTVDLEHNNIVTVTTFLSKDGNFDYYKLRNNLSAFAALSEIASAGYNQTIDQDTSAEKFIADFQKNYDLYSTELPVTYSEYDEKNRLSKYITARANYDCDTTLCLEIVIFDQNDKSLIAKLLEEAGFNLEDFEIEYKVY